jgi:hypothetical protein
MQTVRVCPNHVTGAPAVSDMRVVLYFTIYLGHHDLSAFLFDAAPRL